MTELQRFYPIGSPGQAWGPAEVAQWRAQQRRQRSYADDVLRATDALRHRFDVQIHGEVRHGDERYPLVAVRNHWQAGLPTVLVTGGVHGYETSGVRGALLFLTTEAQKYSQVGFRFFLVCSRGCILRHTALRRLTLPCVHAFAHGATSLCGNLRSRAE